MLLTLGSRIKERKVQLSKIPNFGLRNGHSYHFSMSQLAIVGNSLKVVVTDPSFLVGGGTSRVSGRRSQLMIVPSQNGSFSFNEFVLNVPKALHQRKKETREGGEKKRLDASRLESCQARDGQQDRSILYGHSNPPLTPTPKYSGVATSASSANAWRGATKAAAAVEATVASTERRDDVDDDDGLI